MSGPWYESQGPNKEYVYKDIMEHFTKSHMFTNNIGYNIMNYGYLSLLVKKLINEEYNHSYAFGSYRGYATFTRKTLIESILEKLETRKLEIAYNILCNSRVMHILMNSAIYKPGKQRVKLLESKFNKIKRDYR